MTDLRTLLGVAHPILQAPMAGSQGSRLAIAVAEAGGLGAIACGVLDTTTIASEVAAIRAATDRPFNLNFLCHPPPAPDAAREAAWAARLAPYAHELGVSDATTNVLRREPFSSAQAACVEALRPRVVSFHFGLPEDALLDRVRRAGALVLSSATTVDEARWLEGRGVDAIIVQGLEAGGHRGLFLDDDLATQCGTLDLLAAIGATVRVPLIAAGGIATEQDVVRARLAGASGVQVGTAYLFTPEAATTPLHRAALRDATSRVTTLTNVFTGRPGRAFVNRLVRELGPIASDAPAFPNAAIPIARLRAAAESAGSDEFSPLWSGTGAARCVERSAADLTRALAAGFETT